MQMMEFSHSEESLFGLGISWVTKDGVQRANYFGSLTQASTWHIGAYSGEEIYVPLKSLLPLVDPNDVILGGWDISSMNLADVTARARVLDIDFQKQLRPYMQDMVPLPGVYEPDFIAANQGVRVDNYIKGTNWSSWSSSKRTSGTIEFAVEQNVLIGGDEFKTGQTKMKYVLVDFLVCDGIKPTSIVSYNHLGNNNGMKLGRHCCVIVFFMLQFLGLVSPKLSDLRRSESNVVEDMVSTNSILYGPGEHLDHVGVIKVCFILLADYFR
ncbi:hypothetical protein R1sor_012892 [Riccia sorocarpa]|uniref:inositol-3-phosphate synthase n=1 Tax=Riccia sorocarpa TaxID=122646 RepID=A0ABD3I950_9MARC